MSAPAASIAAITVLLRTVLVPEVSRGETKTIEDSFASSSL
jgi:hypothetical protein